MDPCFVHKFFPCHSLKESRQLPACNDYPRDPSPTAFFFANTRTLYKRKIFGNVNMMSHLPAPHSDPDSKYELLYKQAKVMIQSGDKGAQQRAMLLIQKLPIEMGLNILFQILDTSKFEFVRATAVMLLGNIGYNGNEAIKQKCYDRMVEEIQGASDYGIKAGAAAGLGYLEDIRGEDILIRTYLEDTDWQVQFSALTSLGTIGSQKAVPLLIDALKSENDIIVQVAIGALGDIGDQSAIGPMLEKTDSKDIMTRQRLADVLGYFEKEDRILASLNILAQDKSNIVKEAALRSIQLLNETKFQSETAI